MAFPSSTRLLLAGLTDARVRECRHGGVGDFSEVVQLAPQLDPARKLAFLPRRLQQPFVSRPRLLFAVERDGQPHPVLRRFSWSMDSQLRVVVALRLPHQDDDRPRRSAPERRPRDGSCSLSWFGFRVTVMDHGTFRRDPAARPQPGTC